MEEYSLTRISSSAVADILQTLFLLFFSSEMSADRASRKRKVVNYNLNSALDSDDDFCDKSTRKKGSSSAKSSELSDLGDQPSPAKPSALKGASATRKSKVLESDEGSDVEGSTFEGSISDADSDSVSEDNYSENEKPVAKPAKTKAAPNATQSKTSRNKVAPKATVTSAAKVSTAKGKVDRPPLKPMGQSLSRGSLSKPIQHSSVSSSVNQAPLRRLGLSRNRAVAKPLHTIHPEA